MGVTAAKIIETSDKQNASLRPTTSVRSTRYEKTSRVSPRYGPLASGFCSFSRETEPRYLPLGWSEYTHPEGQLYFVYQSSPRIVTEAYLYALDVQDKISYWIEQFNRRLAASATHLPESAELFLELEEADTCLYYLVDYDARVEFWIEELDTEVLGLSPAVSDSHRRLELEEHFWTHMEYFPSHRCYELALFKDELTSVFLHARGDQLTSAYSTFPYSAKQCAEFLEVLSSAPCCSVSPYSTSLIARLWGVVYRHRFSTHYGQEHARLSRDQSVLDAPEIHRSRMFCGASCLLFKIPNAYLRTLDALHVDNLVYVDQWRSAIVACREEWILYSSWGLALLIVNILSFDIPCTNHRIALSSTLLCFSAVISAVVLLVSHHGATTFQASDAAEYLSERRRETSGFQLTALAFSLPKALFLWALCAFAAQGFVWLLDATNVYVVSGAITAMLVLGLCSRVISIPWPSSEGWPVAAVRSLFPKFQADDKTHDLESSPV